MEHQIKRRAGRKMQRGRLVVDQDRGRMGIFVDYCHNCEAKLILDRDEVTQLSRWVRKDEKSRSRKILEFFLLNRLI